MLTIKQAAEHWLTLGFDLLPIQPNSKMIVSGFGIHQRRIKQRSEIELLIPPLCNLAVISPAGFYILDFDSPPVFDRWADNCPEGAASLLEITPRGGRHVFLKGSPSFAIKLVPGVELKRAVIVSPSQINGVNYQQGVNGSILDVDPNYSLATISAEDPRPMAQDPLNEKKRFLGSSSQSTVERIKRHHTLSGVLKLYKPDITLSGRGDYQAARCPWHDDKTASFWVNDRLGRWGCHACHISGDVINLYARLQSLPVGEAIKRMAAVLP